MNNKKEIKNILIIGIKGGLAKLTTRILLEKHPNVNIIGIDSRECHKFIQNDNFEVKQMRYTRNNFEKLFRENKFDALIHLGRISHEHLFKSATKKKAMLDMNIIGTSKILDLAKSNNVKKVFLMSTFHVYGAFVDNSAFIKEDDPLKAVMAYPELRDVVEMDRIATNWMWKYQNEIDTIVFRPCNIIGPEINNAITNYLRASYAPVPIDFNPMMQFIHQKDMGNIIVKSIFTLETGVYNVAPDEFISIRNAKQLVGLPTFPFPIILLQLPTKILANRYWEFPNYLIDYMKFSCLLSNKLLKDQLGENLFEFNAKDSLKSLIM